MNLARSNYLINPLQIKYYKSKKMKTALLLFMVKPLLESQRLKSLPTLINFLRKTAPNSNLLIMTIQII